MIFCADWAEQIDKAADIESLRKISRDILAHSERQTKIVMWMRNNDPRQCVSGIAPRFKRRFDDFIKSLDAS